MGIHRIINNRKRTHLQERKWKLGRLRRAEKKRRQVPKVRMVQDIHLLSKDQIKHIVKGTASSLSVSGKRRRKMLKRINNQKRNKMSVETATDSVKPQTKSKNKKSTTSVTDNDVALASGSGDIEMTALG